MMEQEITMKEKEIKLQVIAELAKEMNTFDLDGVIAFMIGISSKD